MYIEVAEVLRNGEDIQRSLGMAQILLQVPVAGPVACLGAGVDAVEQLRLHFEVKSEALEVFVPVWVLDDDFDLGLASVRRRKERRALA